MSLLLTLCLLLLAATGTFVLLSYIIVWYEAANRNPELVAQRFAPRGLAFAAGLMARETLSLALTVLAHPLGWMPESKPAHQAGRPILLLHGLFHNRSCWWLVKRRLARAGLGPIHVMNLNTWRSDVEPLTERVADKVDQLRMAHGVAQVDVIGHSMGGILARNFVQLRGGAAKVRHCIGLATPHDGSRLAPFALTPLARVLMPGSDFLQRLAAAPRPAGVRFTNIYSRHDNLVIPAESALLENSSCIEVSGIGHSSLLLSRRVVDQLIAILGEKDPHEQA
ncbi:esterase/lipase family protein [Geoalkalibacter sp.]|uniref:esterase/lipase family protein n=1 Tax=Geoalkalibacter sp. TaxID=3041440 RepID=UPI00272EA1ED|nr:alpha/beta fold hydrolase [Geoalkalibacter sp.]